MKQKEIELKIYQKFSSDIFERLTILILLLLTAAFTYSQTGGVSVNTTGAQPDASAILDVSANDRGVLIPRLSKNEKLAIQSPATGLVVFQTNDTTGFWYYNGTQWEQVGGQSSAMQPGTNPGEILYWDGTNWLPISPGTHAQTLSFCNGIPTWGACLPMITTNSMSNIAATYATGGGNVTNDGGATVTTRGVCWNTTPSPTTANSTTNNGSGTGSFSSSLTGLTAQTTYYVRAYAINSAGTAYGNEVNFTTPAIVLPTVTTSSITSITGFTASGGGNVTNDGGANVTARGICWNTSPTPTTSNSFTSNGTGTGSFTSSLTGLTPNTTYYVRAYATSVAGTAYGNEVSFTTPVVMPVVTTANITSITGSTAAGGGEVTSSGGGTVTARGICWSKSQNPTIANSFTVNGSGTGIFTSALTGLDGQSTYYVRAYATNSIGTAYGNQVSFTTPDGPPTVTTTAVTNITGTMAITGGNVTHDGGATVLARGVCWNTSPSPTIANSITTNGPGTGSFTSQPTGMTRGTTYYLRAYATNTHGTSYGNEFSFTTFNLDIGDSYLGGIVAVLLQPGDPGYTAGTEHGIIITNSPLSGSYQWGCEGAAVGGTSKNIGSGQANTTAIVNFHNAIPNFYTNPTQCNASNNGQVAAKSCDDLVTGGYSDWYLSSSEEFGRMYPYRSILNINGIMNWTSSELSSSNAVIRRYEANTEQSVYKAYAGDVRCSRSF